LSALDHQLLPTNGVYYNNVVGTLPGWQVANSRYLNNPGVVEGQSCKPPSFPLGSKKNITARM
jgi:hypothetical protein